MIVNETTNNMDNVKPVSESATDSIQKLLISVMRSIIYRANVGSALLELPVLQVKCLSIVAQGEGLTMKQVAEKMEIDLPGLTRVVDRLSKRNLIARTYDPTNRRVVRLNLTDESRHMITQRSEACQNRVWECLQYVCEADRNKIIEGLQILATAAKKTDAETVTPSNISLVDDPIVQLATSFPRANRKTTSPE